MYYDPLFLWMLAGLVVMVGLLLAGFVHMDACLMRQTRIYEVGDRVKFRHKGKKYSGEICQLPSLKEHQTMSQRTAYIKCRETRRVEYVWYRDIYDLDWVARRTAR